jgi:hypothetical protein
VLQGKVIGGDQAQRLAALESREIQLGKIARLVNTPLQQLVNVLAAPLRDLGSMLAQVVAKKESGELDAPPAPEVAREPATGQAVEADAAGEADSAPETGGETETAGDAEPAPVTEAAVAEPEAAEASAPVPGTAEAAAPEPVESRTAPAESGEAAGEEPQNQSRDVTDAQDSVESEKE